MFEFEPMKIAIQMANKASCNNEIPVGCVITNKFGEILASSYNEVEKLQDATCHAEMTAIKTACKKINSKFLIDCNIYITLEPCFMCASAISHAKIKRVYIGTQDEKFGAIQKGIYQKNNVNHIPETYFSIMEDECKSIIKLFFTKLRC